MDRDIKSKYPFVEKLDFGYDPGTYYKDLLDKNRNMGYLDTMFVIKHHSVCISGDNIQDKIPDFKLSTIPRSYYDLGKIIEKLKRNLFDPNVDPSRIKMMMGWISKKIVRNGFELIMDDSDVYTRDLYQCWKLFSEKYPEKEDLMKKALEKAIYPTEDRNDLFNIFNGIGDWIVKEIERKLKNKNKDKFNVQSLRKVQNELYKTY